MQMAVDDEFRSICKEIISQNKTEEQWSEIESDDMFQSSSYVGGFEAIEKAFCFSVYKNDEEFWFQLGLEDIENILNGKVETIELRYPN